MPEDLLERLGEEVSEVSRLQAILAERTAGLEARLNTLSGVEERLRTAEVSLGGIGERLRGGAEHFASIERALDNKVETKSVKMILTGIAVGSALGGSGITAAILKLAGAF